MRLAQLSGTNASGTIQVAEHSLNELLSMWTHGAAHQPVVELLPRNRVAVRYGLFHARAELPQALDPGPSPKLTFHLASLLVAIGLKALVHAPFLHVHGRRLTIDLARLPGPQPWREMMLHFRRLAFETAPGALRVAFEIDIKEED